MTQSVFVIVLCEHAAQRCLFVHALEFFTVLLSLNAINSIQLIYSMPAIGYSDAQVNRILRDAEDVCDSHTVTTFKDPLVSSPAPARLIQLIQSAEYTHLPSNVKEYEEKNVIDRRFEGPRSRRTRDYEDWTEEDFDAMDAYANEMWM